MSSPLPNGAMFETVAELWLFLQGDLIRVSGENDDAESQLLLDGHEGNVWSVATHPSNPVLTRRF